jgi:hypothetical protein
MSKEHKGSWWDRRKIIADPRPAETIWGKQCEIVGYTPSIGMSKPFENLGKGVIIKTTGDSGVIFESVVHPKAIKHGKT